MSKNLFCILSHCDSDEKKLVLIDNINQIKNKGFDILLVSHIPLSSDITSLVNYFIYDKSNPILRYPQKSLHMWWHVIFNSEEYELSTHLPDYGWTALNQIKKVGAFCENLEYSNYTFINYDIQFTDEILSNHNTNLLSQTKLTKLHLDGLLFSTLFFSFSSMDLNKIWKSLIMEEYENDGLICEKYFTKVIVNENLDYQIYPLEVEDQLDFKIIEDEEIWDFNTGNDYFRLFFDDEVIILYMLKGDIKFNINGVDIVKCGNFSINRSQNKNIGYYDLDDKLVDIIPLLKNNDNIITEIKKVND